MEGWPEGWNQVPLQLRKYWAYRDKKSVDDGLVMKGDCVMISKSLQAEMLQKLHSAHQGVEKTRLRARTFVYWSIINADIESMINKCGVCQEMQLA